MVPCPQKRIGSRLVSLLGSADFEKVKGKRNLKEMLILNSFSFKDKDPRFTRLKLGLALRLLSKGLFYIRAMVENSKMLFTKALNRKKKRKLQSTLFFCLTLATSGTF